MKKIYTTILLLFFLTGFAWGFLNYSGTGKKIKSLYLPKQSTTYTLGSHFETLRTRASAAKSFVKANNYNTGVCFLVDMSMPSGHNRFFVYDLKNDTIQNAGLVSHGRCNENWLEGRKYGNTVGCGCTSLGKYKIGNPYIGRFGLAFKLYGLEKTNDKAFERFVVLHSYECVPETEVKSDICQSDGCPMVAPGFLQELKPIIQKSSKPILLWIFE